MAAKPSRSAEDRLTLFVARVEQTVRRRAIVNKTLAARFTLEHKDGQSTFTTDTGDEEDFRSLLLDFRSFLAPKEDVHVNRIFNIIEQQTNDLELQEANRQNRQQWDVARRGQMSLLINEKPLTAEQCFDLCVNGDIFHQDADKAARLASLPDFMQGIVRQQMVSFVIEGLGPLWATHNVALALLAEPSER